MILLFCLARIEVAKNYKRLLNCFGVMSGLSINYWKSGLISFSCELNHVECMKHVLNYMVVNLPAKYLGLPLGANPRIVDT